MIPNYPRGKRIINYGAKLSEIEKDFIHRNAKTSTAKEIAEALHKSYSLIYEYCRKVGIQYKETKPTGRPRNTDRVPTEIKADRKYLTNEEFTSSRNKSGKLIRPEAKYGNRSWEETIAYYENLKV